MKSFLYRGSRPRPMAQPPAQRILSPAGQRLSTIMEQGSVVGSDGHAADPNRASHRLTNSSLEHRMHMGMPPDFTEEKQPPSYLAKGTVASGLGVLDREEGRNGRPFTLLPEGVTHNMHQRGGWRRILLVALAVIIILAIALGVGLGVGLSQHNHNSSAPASSTGSGPASLPPQSGNTTQPFPLGNWVFTTYLTNTSTACTSNAALWSCPPYSDYSSADPTASQYLLNWQISASSKQNEYLVSSTDPFGITFSNASMTLVDAGQASERYALSVPNVAKSVVPSQSLFPDNAATTCFFNSTSLQGSLYTRMSSQGASSSSSSSSSSSPSSASPTGGVGNTYNPWPFAAQIAAVAKGGQGVPSCYATENGKATGSPAALADEPSSAECQCLYENYNL